MNLDILTARGQKTLEQEERAAEIIESNWLGCKYIDTPKTKISAVDAIILRNNVVGAVAETKCRDMTRAKLASDFNNEWLVTYDKLLKGAQISTMLYVPYWGFLYLVPDDLVLRIKLYSPEDGWLVTFRVEKTITQRTVNGGSIARDNAFIDMSSADLLT